MRIVGAVAADVVVDCLDDECRCGNLLERGTCLVGESRRDRTASGGVGDVAFGFGEDGDEPLVDAVDLGSGGRPLVDTIAGSAIPNMKELRPGSVGMSEIRILFAFDPWRSAIRKRRGLTQAQVARRMGISVSRVSQIEKRDVSTREVMDRYVGALDGILNLVADFGDEQLKVG